jgi:MFS family permease
VAAPLDRAAGRATPGLAVLDALQDPHYRRFWLAGLCVNTARWMDFLILGWLVLELTDSPFMVGVAAFCRNAPMMALGLLAGVLADRFPRGRLMLFVQSLNLGTALVLALLFGSGLGELWSLLALEVLLGAAWAIDFPARRAVLYTLVGPGRLTNAVSLDSVSMQGTKMLGPLLGGLLLGRIGPAGCYLVLAALFLAALVLVALVVRRAKLPPSTQTESALTGLATGLREARTNAAIMGVLVITVLMNLLVFPYQQMLPVFVRDVFRVGPEQLGLLVAVDGLGALGGALFLASRRNFSRHRQVFAGGSLLAATLVIGLALSPSYWISLPVQFVIGIAESGFATMQATIVLLSAPERSRGRVLGILSMCIGTGPFGALWTGFLASQIGAPYATAGAAAVALVLMALVSARLLAGQPARLEAWETGRSSSVSP